MIFQSRHICRYLSLMLFFTCLATQAKEEKSGFILRTGPSGNSEVLLSEPPADHFRILLQDIKQEEVAGQVETWWEIELMLPPAPGSKVTRVIGGFMSESNIKKQFNIENKDANGNILYGKVDTREEIKKAEPAETKNEESAGGLAATGANSAKKVANHISKKIKIVDEATGKDKLIDSNEPIKFVSAHKNGWAQSIKLADGSIAYTATSNFRHFTNIIEEKEEKEAEATQVKATETTKIALVQWDDKNKTIGDKTYYIPSNSKGIVLKKNEGGWGYTVQIPDTIRAANNIPKNAHIVTSSDNLAAFENASFPDIPSAKIPKKEEASTTKNTPLPNKHSDTTAINGVSETRKNLISNFIQTSDGLKTRSILTPRKTVSQTCQTDLDQEIVKNIINENGSCSKELVALVKATIMQESKWDIGAYRYESELHLQDWARNMFIPYRNIRGYNKPLSNPNHPLRKEFFASYGLMQYIVPTAYGRALADNEAGKATPQQKTILDKNFNSMRLLEPKTNLYFGIQYLMSHVKKAKKGWPNEWQLAAAAGYNSGQTGNYAGVHDKYHYKVKKYYDEYLKCGNADKVCKQ